MSLSGLDFLLAEHACRQVVVLSAQAVDRRDFAAFARLFVPDGVLIRPDGTRLVGRAAIEAAYEQRSPDRLTRHLISNHLVQIHDIERASSNCNVQLWGGSYKDAEGSKGRPADATQLIGEFDDELVMTADGWRIRQRLARFVLHHGA
jgi:ketosteroid isomerase-like protein